MAPEAHTRRPARVASAGCAWHRIIGMYTFRGHGISGHTLLNCVPGPGSTQLPELNRQRTQNFWVFLMATFLSLAVEGVKRQIAAPACKADSEGAAGHECLGEEYEIAPQSLMRGARTQAHENMECGASAQPGGDVPCCVEARHSMSIWAGVVARAASSFRTP